MAQELNTVDEVVDEIIAEMPLDDWVRTAKLDADGLLALQLTLSKYLRYLIDNQSELGSTFNQKREHMNGS